jgi:hypothetical protein
MGTGVVCNLRKTCGETVEPCVEGRLLRGRRAKVRRGRGGGKAKCTQVHAKCRLLSVGCTPGIDDGNLGAWFWECGRKCWRPDPVLRF